MHNMYCNLFAIYAIMRNEQCPCTLDVIHILPTPLVILYYTGLSMTKYGQTHQLVSHANECTRDPGSNSNDNHFLFMASNPYSNLDINTSVETTYPKVTVMV